MGRHIGQRPLDRRRRRQTARCPATTARVSRQAGRRWRAARAPATLEVGLAARDAAPRPASPPARRSPPPLRPGPTAPHLAAPPDRQPDGQTHPRPAPTASRAQAQAACDRRWTPSFTGLDATTSASKHTASSKATWAGLAVRRDEQADVYVRAHHAPRLCDELALTPASADQASAIIRAVPAQGPR